MKNEKSLLEVLAPIDKKYQEGQICNDLQKKFRENTKHLLMRIFDPDAVLHSLFVEDEDFVELSGKENEK